jgi:hypothetical protein
MDQYSEWYLGLCGLIMVSVVLWFSEPVANAQAYEEK